MFMRFTFSLCYSRLWFDDLIVWWCLWWIVVTGILHATRSSGVFFFLFTRLWFLFSSLRFLFVSKVFWKLITIRSSILNFRLLLVYFSFCCWLVVDCGWCYDRSVIVFLDFCHAFSLRYVFKRILIRSSFSLLSFLISLIIYSSRGWFLNCIEWSVLIHVMEDAMIDRWWLWLILVMRFLRIFCLSTPNF